MSDGVGISKNSHAWFFSRLSFTARQILPACMNDVKKSTYINFKFVRYSYSKEVSASFAFIELFALQQQLKKTYMRENINS
jgi:hypothetical protein